MQQDLTPEQKRFLDKTSAHRKEKVEQLAYQSLALALKQDLPVFELPYYVLQRARAIVETAFKRVDFENPELQAARTAFLKVCLQQIKDSTLILAPKENPDETDIRDQACEPLAQAIVTMLLDEDLVFSDEEYFKRVLADEESVPLNAAIGGYMHALDEKMSMIISEHWRRAVDSLWGVEKEKVTFSMLDDVLKKLER